MYVYIILDKTNQDQNKIIHNNMKHPPRKHIKYEVAMKTSGLVSNYAISFIYRFKALYFKSINILSEIMFEILLMPSQMTLLRVTKRANTDGAAVVSNSLTVLYSQKKAFVVSHIIVLLLSIYFFCTLSFLKYFIYVQVN